MNDTNGLTLVVMSAVYVCKGYDMVGVNIHAPVFGESNRQDRSNRHKA